MANHGRGAATRDDDADEAASFMAAQELIKAHAVSMTLKAAMELGLIDALCCAAPGRALTAAELAAELPAANEPEAAAAVDRMLRFLASHGVVRCCSITSAAAVEEYHQDQEEAGHQMQDSADIHHQLRRYSAAPVCRWLSSNNNGEGSLAAMAMYGFQQPLLTPWQHMAESVLQGRSAFEVANRGTSASELRRKDPHLSALFNQAMSQLSTLTCDRMLRRFTGFDDPSIGVLVDVGGGVGTVLGMITARYGHIARGINFDLPFVVSQARPIPRVEHVAGDMLDSVPSGDAVFMKSVMHLLDDDDCVKLLRNCHRAVPERGKVIAMEVVLPEAPDPATQAGRFPFLYDMICLLSSRKGGRERTEREFARLAVDAGFGGAVRSTFVFGAHWVLEFTK